MRRGFTLIEIMIVIALLAILTTSFMANIRTARGRANDSKRKNDLRQIAVSLEAYFNDKEEYPDDDESGGIMGCGTIDETTICAWGSNFTFDSVTYMPQLPRDPDTRYTYYYDRIDVNTYKIYSYLENADDSAYRTYSSYCDTAGTLHCHYALSSQNTTP